MRKKRIGLEHHVHSPLVRWDPGDVLPRQFDGAAGWIFKARKHPHHGRLAAARRAQQGKELLLKNIEGQIVNGGEITEPFGHIAKADQRFLFRVVPGGEYSLCQGKVRSKIEMGAREPRAHLVRL